MFKVSQKCLFLTSESEVDLKESSKNCLIKIFSNTDQSSGALSLLAVTLPSV